MIVYENANTYKKLKRFSLLKKLLKEGIVTIKEITQETVDNNLLANAISLIQSQLQVMPREYIFDQMLNKKNSIYCLEKQGRMVSAMLIRRFSDFIELIFLAVSDHNKGEGVGEFMIEYMKDYWKKYFQGNYYIVGYADILAIGFFKKLGFQQKIKNSSWIGIIKDYKEGVLVEANVYYDFPYLDKVEMIEGLINEEGMVEKFTYDELDKEKLQIYTKVRNHSVSLQNIFEYILATMMSIDISYPFLEPVREEEAPNYYIMIKSPMDLGTMYLKNKSEKYESFNDFISDFNLMIANCKKYNGVGNIYTKYAVQLEKAFNKKVIEMKNKVKKIL